MTKSQLSMGGATCFALKHPDLDHGQARYLCLDWNSRSNTMDEFFVFEDEGPTFFDQAALAELLKNDHYNMLEPVQLRPALWAA